MPELPEVEIIRRDLIKKIMNKKIVHVEVYHNTSVGNMSTKFVQALTGNAIVKIDRRGKLLIWRLKKSLSAGRQGTQSILVHLKMTGQLIYVRLHRSPSPYRGRDRGGG